MQVCMIVCLCVCHLLLCTVASEIHYFGAWYLLSKCSFVTSEVFCSSCNVAFHPHLLILHLGKASTDYWKTNLSKKNLSTLGEFLQHCISKEIGQI